MSDLFALPGGSSHLPSMTIPSAAPVSAPVSVPVPTDQKLRPLPSDRRRLVFCWAPYNRGTARDWQNQLKQMWTGAATIHVEVYNPHDGCSLWITNKTGKLIYQKRPLGYSNEWIFLEVELSLEQYVIFTTFVVDNTVNRQLLCDTSHMFWYLAYQMYDGMPEGTTNCSRSVAELIHAIWGIGYRYGIASYTPDMTMNMLKDAAEANPRMNLREIESPTPSPFETVHGVSK